MTEPGSGGDKLDTIPALIPIIEQDIITNEIQIAAELFRSPNLKKRKLAAAAIIRAAEYAVDDPSAGELFSKLLVPRGVHAETNDNSGIELHQSDEEFRMTLERYEALVEELRHSSEHDALTGLYNRRRAETEIEMLRKEGRRKRKYPVSFLYIDVDNFKQINDLKGHDVGDETLQTIAQLISCGKSRPEDIVARFGGDEFLFIMQQASSDIALKVVERINNAFYGHNLQQGDALSVSVGIGTALNSKSLTCALQSADLNMYEVKKEKNSSNNKSELNSQL